MSRKERARLEVFARVRDGEVSVAKAAALLKLSERQARRAYKRYREKGDAGLVHGLRGKPGNRKTDEATREAVLKLYPGKRSTRTSGRRWRRRSWRSWTGTR